MELSIIVPAFNEEEFIFLSLTKLTNAFNHQSLKFEIIIINDGSNDNTMNQIKNRIKLNIDEYQDIHSNKINLESYNKILSKPRFILTSIGKNENEGIRYYSISE